jgi:hypothetical protein
MGTKSDKITWKDTIAEHDGFLGAYPRFRKNGKVMSVLRTMSVWMLQSKLKEESRFLELVWIQPNLTEITINSMLSTYLFTIVRKKRKEHNDRLIRDLNLDKKIKLLYSPGLIDNKLLSNLESYRKTRNALTHKLMKEAQIGKNIDKECERFCKLGFQIQEELHQLLMEYVRAQMR